MEASFDRRILNQLEIPLQRHGKNPNLLDIPLGPLDAPNPPLGQQSRKKSWQDLPNRARSFEVPRMTRAPLDYSTTIDDSRPSRSFDDALITRNSFCKQRSFESTSRGLVNRGDTLRVLTPSPDPPSPGRDSPKMLSRSPAAVRRDAFRLQSRSPEMLAYSDSPLLGRRSPSPAKDLFLSSGGPSPGHIQVSPKSKRKDSIGGHCAGRLTPSPTQLRRSFGSASDPSTSTSLSFDEEFMFLDLSDSDSGAQSSAITPYTVLVLGSEGVGKTALIDQFMTSEFLGGFDTDETDDSEGVKTVSVLLDDEESIINFKEMRDNEVQEIALYDEKYKVDAYLVVFSLISRQSYLHAKNVLKTLNEEPHHCAILLIGNKNDIVRNRKVSCEGAKTSSKECSCYYIETSASLNYNVDELLVQTVKQIRKKEERDEKSKRRRSSSAVRLRNAAKDLKHKVSKIQKQLSITKL
ncbi:unnamed protein product [Owenia fusiformis]|uniref:Uncharacterized protein n=1 Tax=Owenia fusiformis TaxID=6347 RepID=A0A8S4PWV7_OWEFU|nr:unnamed protein product [Owenia fusiformis]